jgi:hypothetical protein
MIDANYLAVFPALFVFNWIEACWLFRGQCDRTLCYYLLTAFGFQGVLVDVVYTLYGCDFK